MTKSEFFRKIRGGDFLFLWLLNKPHLLVKIILKTETEQKHITCFTSWVATSSILLFRLQKLKSWWKTKHDPAEGQSGGWQMERESVISKFVKWLLWIEGISKGVLGVGGHAHWPTALKLVQAGIPAQNRFNMSKIQQARESSWNDSTNNSSNLITEKFWLKLFVLKLCLNLIHDSVAASAADASPKIDE